MPKLFEKTEIKSMELANRFVRSATWEGMAGTDGSCTQGLIDVTAGLAEGGVGLIITGHAYVSPEGQAGPWQIGVHSDEMLPGLTRMAAAVHGAGGKIALQIAHAGCYGFASGTGIEAVGPSPCIAEKTPTCRELTHEEIGAICAAFGRAAVRAKEAGFDAVQIHSAHGYLLSEFLSPFFNRRNDEYGGSIENRARIVLKVLHSVRSAVGEDYPVLIKLNSQDFIDGGLAVEEMLVVASLLEKAGVDAIEMSGGTIYASGEYSAIRTGVLSKPEEEGYYRDAAARFKAALSVPLMLVGGVRSFEVAEALVNDGKADYISLCRPLIREPGLVNRWRSGDRRKAGCLSENACFGPLMKGEGLCCPIKKGEV
ncbi:MAG: NADH:flavin oxidoreductase [Desulfuromonadales bacterium]|nr:NADH:flavin oxidoreductase [Desulfuromonadales bacterium]